VAWATDSPAAETDVRPDGIIRGWLLRLEAGHGRLLANKVRITKCHSGDNSHGKVGQERSNDGRPLS
jgi:hypothetical protein